MTNTLKQRGLTIFVGDVQEDLAHQAKKYDASAWLLDQSNYDLLDSRNNSTVYTSLGDLPKNLLTVLDIFRRAKEIYYCPPPQWSGSQTQDVTDPTITVQGLTETLLMLVSDSVMIHSVDQLGSWYNDPRQLVDHRRGNDPQIWVAGCSISHGVGVESKQKYGELLSQYLQLPCSHLTRSGSAIDWAADQILRSDIRENDIVVWGITSWSRLTHVYQDRLLAGVTLQTYESFPEYQKIINKTNLFSQQTFYNHLYSIKQVINFCEKVKAKLVMITMLLDNFALLGFLKQYNNYIRVPYEIEYTDSVLVEKFLDLGSDNAHPGPQQHQFYADLIYRFLKQ